MIFQYINIVTICGFLFKTAYTEDTGTSLHLKFTYVPTDEDVEESCAFDANFISELEKAKKLLTEKAKIQIFSEIQPELLEHLRSANGMRPNNLHVKIAVSEALHEDLSYFLISNNLTFYPEAEDKQVPKCGTQCSISTLESLLAKPINFNTDDERSAALQSLPHISHFLYKEIMEHGKLGIMTFIGYWSPDDAKSMQMLEMLTEVVKAENNTYELYLINCKYFASLCQREGIEKVPQLKAFLDNKIYQVFDGAFTLNGIKRWIQMLKEPEVHDLTESAVEKYREGIMTGTVFSEEVQQAITVGFFSNEKSPIYQKFMKAAHKFHGKYHFGIFKNPKVAEWAHNPAIFTFKPKEILEKVVVWYDGLSNETVEEFIVRSSVPTFVRFR
ncbi:unnamed protein product [Enterobius vermicularis]|uniref:Thioredoxin domain-containing protein n=1 Tax=Enterobius vermicularis TaxID=51028 RepID=A0A0N4VKZ7_ENTVE|nr:unnamed protein product [Enterobius vermicularis]